MADIIIRQQKGLFDKLSKPQDTMPTRQEALTKANGFEPPNLGKAIRLTVPDFSDPCRTPVCLEVDFPIAPINALSKVEVSSGPARKRVYCMSKWWARRASSVFRSMLIAAATEAPSDTSQAAKRVWDHYYCNHRRPVHSANSKCSTSLWAGEPLWSKARALASRWRVLISIPWPGS